MQKHHNSIAKITVRDNGKLKNKSKNTSNVKILVSNMTNIK